MDAGRVFDRVSDELDQFLEPLDMLVPAGPLRAMRELVTGIVWTGSVQLSNAARLRAHHAGQLKRTVERLSHRLADRRWDHRAWAGAVLSEQVRHLDPWSLIPIDATDLAKPYAHHLEYQGVVRDASRRDKPLVSGYWCWGAYHWQPEHAVLAPLMLRPYSTRMPGFLSENDQWRRYLWTLREATGGKGIWLHDRGGDRPDILSAFLRIQPRWIIRLRRDRGLIGPDGQRRPAGEWADWALAHRAPRGRAVTVPVRLPPEDVNQPSDPPSLHLVTPTYTSAQGGRWLLLTCGLIDQRRGPRQVRHHYAARWRSEDARRFLGQIWHVERFLTRSWLALERMLWCVVLAGGFLATLRRQTPRVAEQLEQEVLYWPKDPIVPCYRLARGLQVVATRCGHTAMRQNA
jgi:hypothetical protein